MPPAPDDLARELRAAVLANDHEEALRLTVQFTQAVRDYWTALPGGQRAASPLPKQSLQLLYWVREMTLIQQALTASQLAAAQLAGRYQTARSEYSQR